MQQTMAVWGQIAPARVVRTGPDVWLHGDGC